jgi:hypothetical protein
MKLLFLTLVLTLGFGGFVSTNAQEAQKISVRIGKQTKAARSKLTVKFVELVEDSRCAEGTNCVWAGNATIKVSIKQGSDPAEIFEMNTNTGAKGATYGAYAIYLTSLTPTPKANVRINRNAYTATFSISRLSR